MNKISQKGIIPLIVGIVIAVVLVAGVGAGSAIFIKNKIAEEKAQTELKSVSGSDKVEEIEQTASGKLKFELEGTLTSVNPTNRVVVVKIKSSSDSIASLRSAPE